MFASDLIRRAASELVDSDHTFWSSDDLLQYLNDAISAIVVMRPNIARSTETIEASAGQSRLSLPAGAYKLLSVNHIDGVAVQYIDINQLAQMYPNWRTIQDTPTNWTTQENDEFSFYIFPSPSSSVSVEYDYARQIKVTRSGAIPIPAVYEPMLLDFMLYRAYAKEGQSEASLVRSEYHLKAFQIALNGKAGSDRLVKSQSRGAKQQ